MTGVCFFFFISTIVACRADNGNVEITILLEEMVALKNAVSRMEDVLESQRDLIGDLRIQNHGQEKRIQDLETASKNRDDCCGKLENLIKNEPAPTTESNHTTPDRGHKERIGKQIKLLRKKTIIKGILYLNYYIVIYI